MRYHLQIALAAVGFTLAVPATAAAMCGCMMPVDDTGIPESTQLVSDATQVVMMRHGTKTIQSMQNRYEGPVENFAIVIPTPQILTAENVKTLYPEVFARIDQVSAPKLTEYWQHDPCEQVDGFDAVGGVATEGDGGGRGTNDQNSAPPADPGVVVEAEFKVGEYNIQVLSGEDGASLESWLQENGYRIPAGAGEYLQPYVEAGMYFFVAKVDAAKVRFEEGRAQLSPLRFYYDTDQFTLPIRLGMLNSQGRQDLVVYTLGDSRFEAANVGNATIPTNVSVVTGVKDDFAGFYDQLFEKTLDAYGDVVVTEYSSWAWEVPYEDLMALGGDVVMEDTGGEYYPYDMILSRLHVRYEKDDVGEDIVFREAAPIFGGQEAWGNRGTVDPTLMEQGTMNNGANQFRAHYMITHAWTGAVNCENPAYDRWGGPLEGGDGQPVTVTALNPNNTNAELYFKEGKHDLPVAALVSEDVPEIGLEQEIPPKGEIEGCSATGAVLPSSLAMMLLGLMGLGRRRR